MRLDDLTKTFVLEHGDYCAIDTFKWWQKAFYALVACVLLLLLAYRWDVALCLVTFFLSFWYLSAALFRCVAVFISLTGRGERKVSREQLDALKDDDLPLYTILIPLYKEANIANKIVAHIEHLDYPKNKLDVKLLLEQDDEATVSAVRNCALPAHYAIIVVPDFLPKTKPRACNYGLQMAKGEYCVIFDAEDRPEPDQLKKVVALFRQLPDNYACVQAKLNYYNPRQNLLTRWFTIEYSTTFDLLLPGMELLNVPIPLGGTSNHFRTGMLKKIGGWDPFNVTEDCDLGVRIYTKGFRTCLIDSTTWEEANSKLWNWIRQRSRWIKGFFQTHLTHMRYPIRTAKALGAWGLFGFYMSVGVSSFMMVVNVIYWLACAAYLLLLAHGVGKGQTLWSMIVNTVQGNYEGIEFFGRHLKAWPLLYLGADQDYFWSLVSSLLFSIGCALILANLLFMLCHCLACLKRKYYFLLPFTLLMPLYWVLISVGAWKGFIQLFTKPFYWEKTLHGLTSDEEPLPTEK